MPDIFMHAYLTEIVINNSNKKIVKKLAFIGSEAPDFMYHDIYSKKEDNLRKVSNLLHNQNTKGFFINFLNYLKNNYSDELYSFFIGYICHYALDNKLHPYIYHNVGIYNKSDKNTHKYRGLHTKFEKDLDAAFIKKFKKVKPHKFNFRKHYLNLKKMPKEITEAFKDVLYETYNLKNGDQIITTSFKYFKRNTKYLMTDYFGIKRCIYNVMDVFNKSKDIYYKDLSYKRKPNLNILNSDNQKWFHPVTNEESNKSVEELFFEAYDFVMHLIENINNYIFENEQIDLDNLFTNLSFDTGLEISEDVKMRYFKL